MTTPITLSQFLSGAGGKSHETTTTGPVLGAIPVPDGDFSGVRFRAPGGYLVRELRGAKMRTTEGVFDEFAAAFQFPYYFGENKDAFDECLRDLADFVGSAPGYAVLIRDSDQLLAEEPGQRDWFAEAMRDAAAHRASHGGVFRVVLQGSPTLEAAPLTM
ncbi:barstar family protein [Nocardia sp. BMG51109]|uniref:barstar family protein n=1 Tax=Nocardia sp. BMG51109 TaxID=1056816 RepID=UPI00046322FC|nr:barstar family protein [Nocardia sp. BMG51109]